jgi:hypothetical protein
LFRFILNNSCVLYFGIIETSLQEMPLPLLQIFFILNFGINE